MRTRWGLCLLPPFVLTGLVLVLTQFVFLRSSLYADEGLGLTGDTLTLQNYVEILADPLYLNSMRLTVLLSAGVVVLSLLVTYPAAYVLARMPSRYSIPLVAAITASSFVSIAIKILGLVIVFAADGLLSRALRALGVIQNSVQLLGTTPGVFVGYLHLSIGFMVLMLFSVIQLIPRQLEDAAEIHGASRWRVYWRVLIPISLPGMLTAALIQFNLLMGAFVSAQMLGGGKILTIPVLIQRALTMTADYGSAAALSAILLVTVLAINVGSMLLLTRSRVAGLAA